MEDIKEKEENKKSNVFVDEEDFKKLTLCINQVLFYDSDNLINKENTEDLICPICFYITIQKVVLIKKIHIPTAKNV